MYTYTTPTVTCILEGVNFEQVDYVRVALKGKAEVLKQVNISDIDTDHNSLSIKLTQKETASIGAGTMFIQARVHYTDGTVEATNMISTTMNDVIDKAVI